MVSSAARHRAEKTSRKAGQISSSRPDRVDYDVDLSLLDNVQELLNRNEESEDEKYDCREKYSAFFFENDDGDRGDFRCNSWNCYCCSMRMRYNLIEEVRRLGEEKGLTRFLNLTLDPKKLPEGVDTFDYIQERWNKLRIYLNREFGQTDFVWVSERQPKTGNAHLHVLISRYVPWKWIDRTWKKLGAGHVKIEYADAHRVGNYMSKYLAKNVLMDLPKGANRYGYSSGSIDFEVRKKSESKDESWTLKTHDKVKFAKKESWIVRKVRRYDFIEPPSPPPPDQEGGGKNG